MFDHFVGLAINGLKTTLKIWEKATNVTWIYYLKLWSVVGSLSNTSQLAITCSNLKIKTLEQGVKYVQSLQ